MGSSYSYVTDPNTFATEVKESDDRGQWKTYDYVIVGGGQLRQTWQLDPLIPKHYQNLYKALLDRCLHPVSQKI